MLRRPASRSFAARIAPLIAAGLWGLSSIGCGGAGSGDGANGVADDPGFLDRTPAEWADERVAKFKSGFEHTPEKYRSRKEFVPDLYRFQGATLLVLNGAGGPIPDAFELIRDTLSAANGGTLSSSSSVEGPHRAVHLYEVKDPAALVDAVPYLVQRAYDAGHRVMTVQIDAAAVLAALAPRAGFDDAAVAAMGPAGVDGRTGGMVGLRIDRFWRSDAPRETAEGLRRALFNLGPDGDPSTADTDAAGWTVGWGAFEDPTREEPRPGGSEWIADRKLERQEESRTFDVESTLLLAGPVSDANAWLANVRRDLPGVSIPKEAWPPVVRAELNRSSMPPRMSLHDEFPPPQPTDVNAIVYQDRRAERDAILARLKQNDRRGRR